MKIRLLGIRNKSLPGFTLLESVLVLAIAVMVVSLGVTTLGSYRQELEFNNTCKRVATAVDQAVIYAALKHKPVELQPLNNSLRIRRGPKKEFINFNSDTKVYVSDSIKLIGISTISPGTFVIYDNHNHRRTYTVQMNWGRVVAKDED